MKKVLFSLLIVCFLSGVLFSQSIQITSPTSASKWTTGKSYRITWNKKPGSTQPSRVNICLYDEKGTREIKIIVNRTSNDGRHNWSIPVTHSPGKYMIKITSLDNKVTYASSSAFLIRKVQLKKIVSKPTPAYKAPIDPCEASKNKTTDIVLQNIKAFLNTPEVAVYTFDIKNDGPRCIENVWISVEIDNRVITSKTLKPDFWGTGRKWLLKGNEKLTYQGNVTRPIGKPEASSIDVRIGIVPHSYDLDSSVSNNYKSVVIRWGSEK